MTNRGECETWSEILDWITIARKSGRKIDFKTVNNNQFTVNNNQFSVFLQGSDNLNNPYLNTIVAQTGGILVDHGWLRILGAGSEKLPRNIYSWNKLVIMEKELIKQVTVIGDDVLGGIFAINNGGFKGLHGEVYYFAPDTLEWEGLDVLFEDFLKWVFSNNFQEFYSTFRWVKWEHEVQSISTNQVISIYPPLWSEGVPIGNRSRKPIPIKEMLHLLE